MEARLRWNNETVFVFEISPETFFLLLHPLLRFSKKILKLAGAEKNVALFNYQDSSLCSQTRRNGVTHPLFWKIYAGFGMGWNGSSEQVESRLATRDIYPLSDWKIARNFFFPKKNMTANRESELGEPFGSTVRSLSFPSIWATLFVTQENTDWEKKSFFSLGIFR